MRDNFGWCLGVGKLYYYWKRTLSSETIDFDEYLFEYDTYTMMTSFISIHTHEFCEDKTWSFLITRIENDRSLPHLF